MVPQMINTVANLRLPQTKQGQKLNFLLKVTHLIKKFGNVGVMTKGQLISE